MNCPGHVQVYKSELRSYKDLPIRYGEFGSCHRNEPSGALHGTFRVEDLLKMTDIFFVLKIKLKKKFYNSIVKQLKFMKNSHLIRSILR